MKLTKRSMGSLSPIKRIEIRWVFSSSYQSSGRCIFKHSGISEIFVLVFDLECDKAVFDSSHSPFSLQSIGLFLL